MLFTHLLLESVSSSYTFLLNMDFCLWTLCHFYILKSVNSASRINCSNVGSYNGTHFLYPRKRMTAVSDLMSASLTLFSVTRSLDLSRIWSTCSRISWIQLKYVKIHCNFIKQIFMSLFNSLQFLVILTHQTGMPERNNWVKKTATVSLCIKELPSCGDTVNKYSGIQEFKMLKKFYQIKSWKKKKKKKQENTANAAEKNISN